MKTLETSFTRISGSLNSTFTQVKRDENVAIFERIDPSSKLSQGFEVILIQIKKAGTYPLPGGKEVKYDEDFETYPTSSSWGRLGWSSNNIGRAEDIFNRLKTDQSVHDKVEKTIEPLVETPKQVLTIPENQFTINQLTESSGMDRNVVYLTVRAWMAQGLVKEVGKIKTTSGKGKPATVFGKA